MKIPGDAWWEGARGHLLRLGLPADGPSFPEALTHSSYANERGERGLRSNERIEFLGDAVLSLVITDHFFRRCPDLPEGELTKLRAAVVSEGSLARASDRIGLGSLVRLGKGEEAAGGRRRPALLADLFEALIGALYLDAGLDAARDFVLRQLGGELQEALARGGRSDPKTSLQEIAQREGWELSYRVLAATGPDHARRYRVVVTADGRPLGEGEGRNKKQAEQEAARVACEALRLGGGPGDGERRDCPGDSE